MTVKELIEILQTLDQDSKIEFEADNGVCDSYEIFNVHKPENYHYYLIS